VLQLQQFNASLAAQTPGSPTSSASSLATSTGWRSPLVIDPTGALTAMQGPLSSPSHQRGHSSVSKVSKMLTLHGATTSDLRPRAADVASARRVVSALGGARPKLARRGSTTSITIGSPLVVLPPTPTAPPPDDRLDQLLTEVRNVAARQTVLEQQLKAMVESAYAKPEAPRGHRLDSGAIAYETGRFDEQHWIDGHAPPLTREKSNRHVDRLVHPDGGGI